MSKLLGYSIVKRTSDLVLPFSEDHYPQNCAFRHPHLATQNCVQSLTERSSHLSFHLENRRRLRRRTDKSKSLLDDDSEKETNEKDKTEINTNNKEKILGFEDIETSNGKQK